MEWLFHSYRWGLILQAIALIHFVRRRPDNFWVFVILMGGGIGSLIYIAIEVVPDLGLLRGSLNTFSRKKRIKELEAFVLENSAVGNFEELADLCLEEKQYARARELYDKVVAAGPHTLDPFYRRGLAALALSDPRAAVLDLERVVNTDQKYDFNRAIGLLAAAHGLAGNPEKAEALFKAALDVSTLSETELNYATFLAAQGRNAEARAAAQKMLNRKLTIPRYLQRRERPWFAKAKALLKKLPAA
jgi:hypothetical protein